MVSIYKWCMQSIGKKSLEKFRKAGGESLRMMMISANRTTFIADCGKQLLLQEQSDVLYPRKSRGGGKSLVVICSNSESRPTLWKKAGGKRGKRIPELGFDDGIVDESSRSVYSKGSQSTKLLRIRDTLRRNRKSSDPRAVICNVAEALITLLEPETRSAARDPRIQLVDNFAPVLEECSPRHDLEVSGVIPDCLNGIFVRNGSNPSHYPTGGYHTFDGDGMLHAVRIRAGVPSYSCRYTRTYRYMMEKLAGHPLFPLTLGEVVGISGVGRVALLWLRYGLGLIDGRKGSGAANAGLAFYNGRLLAMSEDDQPYEISVSADGDPITLGRYDFGGKLTSSMTAHPKIDPRTGELFAFSYNIFSKPYVKYFRASPTGDMYPAVPLSFAQPVMMHDFGVTENYALFSECQMHFNIRNLTSGKSPVVIDPNRVSKIGVLPKYDLDDARMQWFEAPGNWMHVVNSWDEGDEVYMLGSRTSPVESIFDDQANVSNLFTEFRMNLKTGKSSQRVVTAEHSLDMGIINANYSGRKTRFAYLNLPGPWPKFGGLAKVDLQADSPEKSIVGYRKYPVGSYGSEPAFVPRSSKPGDSTSSDKEDDGYLITYMHDEIRNISEFVVLNARSPTLQPVASVKLPRRVPYGFHSIFLSEEQLANQNLLPL